MRDKPPLAGLFYRPIPERLDGTEPVFEVFSGRTGMTLLGIYVEEDRLAFLRDEPFASALAAFNLTWADVQRVVAEHRERHTPDFTSRELESARRDLDSARAYVRMAEDRVASLEAAAKAGTPTQAESPAVVFVDDDQGYLEWLAAHFDGYVLNANRSPTPRYLILHRARCSDISGVPARGKVWTGQYLKACADSVGALREWARAEVGGQLTACRRCHPG